MTQGTKKTTKGRKATTAKGRKTKAKKNEPIEILEDEPEVQEAAPPHPPKPSRGRKRGSDTMEDSEATNSEAPAPKKRSTRAKSVAPSQDSEMVDAPAKEPAPKKKGRGPAAKTTRKVSQTSVKSQASAAPEVVGAPDDDEIERQLEADLDRYDSDDENITADSETEKQRARAPAERRPKKSVAPRKASLQSQKDIVSSYAMFGPSPVEPDEAEIEAEYQALEAETKPEQPEQPEPLVVPKKGRKTGTRKASKQTKKAKGPKPAVGEEADELSAPSGEVQYPVLRMEEYPELKPELEPQPEAEPEAADDADISTGTVVTKAEESQPTLPKRGRGRPSKKSLELRKSLENMQQEQQRQSITAETLTEAPIKPQSEGLRSRGSLSSAKGSPVTVTKKPSPIPPKAPTPVAAPAPVQPTPAKTEKALPPPPPSSASKFSEPPTTPRRLHPSRSAKQAAVSPSQSPQSSDAENQRPANKTPSTASVVSKRIILAPVAMTPQQSSPARRNAVAGLQSTTPWRPVDLDLMFTPAPGTQENKENNGVARLLHKGRDLTSPERQMTVEEWIYHNAGLAEQKLKVECEDMVGRFEREGSRALRVLEGLIVE